MIENQNPEADTPPQSLTFGGVFPETHPEGAGDLTLQDPAPQQDFLSLSDPGDKPGVTGKTAQQRATKADFALRGDSPGIDVLLNGIKNGTEQDLRNSAAVAQDIKDREARLQVIRDKASSGQDISPDDVSQMAGLAGYDPKNSPGTIFEKLYSNQFVSSVLSIGKGIGNIVSQHFAQDPDTVAKSSDVAADLIQRQEIAKTAYEDTLAKYQGQGMFSWLEDQSKSLIPLYSTLSLRNQVSGAPTDSLLKGSNLQDQVSYLYSLSPTEMHQKLRETLDRLSDQNPSLALEFAQAVISHSTTDQAFSNAATALDAASVAAPLAKGALGLARLARGASEAKGATTLAGTVEKAISDSPRVTSESPGASGEAGRVTGEVSKAVPETTEVFKAAVRANAPLESNAGDVLTTMGDIPNASKVNVSKRLPELFGEADPLGEGQGMRQLPLLMNPEAVIKGASTNLSAKATDDLLNTIRVNVSRGLSGITDLGKVARLPEDALQKAFQEAQDSLAQRTQHVSDAVIDYKFTRPEETAANVGSVTVRLGKTDGSLFDNIRQAHQAAIQKYGLTPGGFKVSQEGVGFTVDVLKHLDETSGGVRNALLTTENQNPKNLLNTFLGSLSPTSSNSKLSPFQNAQRILTVHASSALQKSFQGMVRDIGSLSRDEVSALKRIMTKNKYDIDPTSISDQNPGGLRGRYYSSQAELEQDYLNTIGRFPSLKESKAYWTFVTASDMDWVMRNLSVFRDLTRQGAERVRLFDTSVGSAGQELQHQGKEFHGVFKDDLPWDNRETAGVVIHTKGEDPQHSYVSPAFASPEYREKIKDLLEKGYKVINVNPMEKVLGDRFGNDTVNFVITKDYERRPLDWSVIPYRPGFHTEYPQPWFVAQPQIRKAGEGAALRHIYEGDTVALGQNTEAEAKKFAGRMDEARLLLKNGAKRSEVEAFLEKNLPFDYDQFKGFFYAFGDEKEPIFSLDHPFLHKPSGSTTSDFHGNALSSRYPGFQDNIRSSYNWFQNVDKKFMGHRDDPLWTIKERGTELQPVYDLQNAREIDPMVSVARGMRNVIRNRYFSDYKLQAMEQWVQQYGHLLKVDNPQDLQANLPRYVHNPEYNTLHADKSELSAAEQSRKALLQLVGTPSALQQKLAWVRQKMVESAYEGFGQKASDYLFDKLVGDGKSFNDPTKLLRGLAFHEKIGLFNIPQLFQNAATSANAIAISPQHGFSGAAAGMAQQFLRMNDSPEMISRMAQIASYAGMKPSVFTESWNELKKTGLLTVGGEHAWRDDMAEPKFFTGALGRFLDKGAVFFNEGERISRLTAWNTAFKEFRAANPDVPITAEIRNKILDRADLFTANMTRASNASWQQGIWSIPSQFWGYNARLMEQMLGKRLTSAERFRVGIINAALYGVPVGTGGSVVGGLWNPYEDIRKYALDKGINTDDWKFQAFHDGLTGFFNKWVTGRPGTLSEKLGPSGTSTLRDIIDGKATLDTLLGASGSTGKDLGKAISPILYWVTNPFRSDDEQLPFSSADALNLLRNVSSVDSAVKNYYALQTGKWISKNGTKLADDISANEAVLNFLTGAQPRSAADRQLMLKMTGDRNTALQDAEARISQDFGRMIEASSNNQDEEARMYQTRISTWIKLAGFRPDELPGLFQRVSREHDLSKVPYEFAFKNASPEVSAARQDRFLSQQPQNSQTNQ